MQAKSKQNKKVSRKSKKILNRIDKKYAKALDRLAKL